jgi:hypothetical protein
MAPPSAVYPIYPEVRNSRPFGMNRLEVWGVVADQTMMRMERECVEAIGLHPKRLAFIITDEKHKIMNRIRYSITLGGRQEAVTVMSPNPRSWWRPTLLNSAAWPPFGGSYRPGEVVCQYEPGSELEDTPESGSHTG